jgi:branched-subunit amino acid transport protein AzlD
MSRLWRVLGWTGWVLLSVVLATAFYLYLVISNA